MLPAYSLARRVHKLQRLQLGLRCLSEEVTSGEEPPVKVKVEEPSIKLKPDEDMRKSKLLQTSAGAVTVAGSHPIFIDTHEAVMKLQNAGELCSMVTAAASKPRPPHPFPSSVVSCVAIIV